MSSNVPSFNTRTYVNNFSKIVPISNYYLTSTQIDNLTIFDKTFDETRRFNAFYCEKYSKQFGMNTTTKYRYLSRIGDTLVDLEKKENDYLVKHVYHFHLYNIKQIKNSKIIKITKKPSTNPEISFTGAIGNKISEKDRFYSVQKVATITNVEKNNNNEENKNDEGNKNNIATYVSTFVTTLSTMTSKYNTVAYNRVSGGRKKKLKTNSKSTKKNTTKRCIAKTKLGKRCKKLCSGTSKKCSIHK